ncbi:hypothetical protein V2J09_020460 [Rumex salicifolius]
MDSKRLDRVWSNRYLPTDLWPLILSRVPVKSLLRFRCVSKSLSLIDDPDFARLHLKSFNNNIHETNLLVVQGVKQQCVVRCSDTFRVNSEILLTRSERCPVVGSLDGLVVLKSDLSSFKVWIEFSSVRRRLPVRSPLRFRCVSKLWLALIDDSDFARSHLKNYKTNRLQNNLFVVQLQDVQCCVLRCNDTFKVNATIPSILGHVNDERGWEVEFFIDGLVLLKRPNPPTSLCHRCKVWNPSIRKSQDVPPSPEIEITPGDSLMHAELGLGNDPGAKDYKLVRLAFKYCSRAPSFAIVRMVSHIGIWL